MYYTTEMTKTHIIPYVMKAVAIGHKKYKDITKHFKLYNTSVPFWDLVRNNKIDDYK
jgi:hypothetical protein